MLSWRSKMRREVQGTDWLWATAASVAATARAGARKLGPIQALQQQ